MANAMKEWRGPIAAAVGVLIGVAVLNQATGGKAVEVGGKVADALNPGPSVAVAAPDVTAARAELPKLVVRPFLNRNGYSRAQFGPAWVDTAIPGVVPANHCDTRSDILRRDLTGVLPKTGCKVASGTLADPYTGKTIVYRAGPTATAIQIDHVVALGEAWRQGAADWTPAQRRQIANDPRNLLAVDGPTNEKKSDDTADQFAPRVAYQCAFAVRIVAVKTIYKLSVTADEHDALDRMLRRCP